MRLIRAIVASVMLALLVAAPGLAQGGADQALHDDVVAAYEEMTKILDDMEASISEAAKPAHAEAKQGLAAIRARLDAAAKMVGDAAVKEYRDIQHALEGIGRDVDGFLHQAGHTLEDIEHKAWHGLQDGIANVGNAINHVLDGLLGRSQPQALEKTLHDKAVAAYEEMTKILDDMEASISEAAKPAHAEAKQGLAAIRARLDAAAKMVGDAAVHEYRDIQHALEGIGRDVDGFLHQAGHTLEDIEHKAWQSLQDGIANVRNALDHALDWFHH